MNGQYYNPTTGSTYSPKNCALLAASQLLSGDDCQEVAGFKQWLDIGRCVAKGQHGTHILMVCDKKFDTGDGGEEKQKVCKRRTVFFKSQTTEFEPKAA